MRTIRAIIYIISVILLISSCEDLPCRKDMVNPTLGMALFEKDSTGLTKIEVRAEFKSIQVGNIFFETEGSSFSAFRLPLTPNLPEELISLNYSSIRRIEKYTQEVNIESIDTIVPGDSLRYENIISADTIVLDSLCYFDTIQNMDICNDTNLWVIQSIRKENKSMADTTYLTDFNQQIKVYYTTELVPVSPECGFMYFYEIDSIEVVQDTYLDTILINDKFLEIPDDIYKDQSININIYF